jgi:N-acetylglucosaminyldiphosphoundecaprenol N-acetyl-beta-D-mannosaminyltransferase
MTATQRALPMARYILGMRVDVTTYSDAAVSVLQWAARRESRYICVANVHMVMEAYDDSDFRQIVNGADLVTSDGMPLVWSLRLLGVPAATRVYGPELMPRLCEEAAVRGIPVGLFGGTPDVLPKLRTRLKSSSPDLAIAYSWSPPFRPLSHEEDRKAVEEINDSGARLLFVGLGCPKQERWMAEHKHRIQAVMLGVGAAFDFLAGIKRQAPAIVQNLGMEWGFRLASEPRRLWKRYLYNNPRFLRLLAGQLVAERHGGPPGGRDQMRPERRVRLGTTRVFPADLTQRHNEDQHELH